MDNGSPPPRMSSNDGIPEDVRKVDAEKADGFVPAGIPADFEVDFRLNEDIEFETKKFAVTDTRHNY